RAKWSVPRLRSCAVDVAPVRAEPSEAAEQVTQALRGEPLEVEETNGGWARVRTAYDYPGWVRLELLGDDVDPRWLAEPREGRPGSGRILHATGRDGVNAVVEEDEPESYRARRRTFFRL